jgi:hypothetical protein
MVQQPAAAMLTRMARPWPILCLALLVGGCFAPADVPRTPSLPPLATPAPAGRTLNPDRTPLPTLPPWPTGWDGDFCAFFADLVTITELAVDIEPTIADGPRRDAKGLAQELAATPAQARPLLEVLAAWADADDLRAVAETLLDTAEQAGAQYVLNLVEGKKKALPRARELRDQLGAVIDEANVALALLAAAGLACPDHALQLERP